LIDIYIFEKNIDVQESAHAEWIQATAQYVTKGKGDKMFSNA
jgi:hypothetical protein